MPTSDRILNVFDPAGSSGSALPGLIEGQGWGLTNGPRLNNLLAEALTDNPSTARRIYYPPALFEIGTTITPPGRNSWRFEGGGGMGKSISNISNGNPIGCFTVLRWTGSTGQPLLALGNHSGLVVDGINFDGRWGTDGANSPGSGQQDLITWNAESDGFFHEFRNCTFFRAQRLFRTIESTLSGPAEIKFNNCLFNNGDFGSGSWDAVAFRGEENQTVNIGFDQCEFNNCPILVACGAGGGAGYAGRISMRDITIASCGLCLQIEGGSQNSNGHIVDGCHVDMAFASFVLYKSTNPFSTMGHAVFRNIKYGSLASSDQDAREFVQVTGFSGTSLSLAGPSGLRVRVGDYIGFVDTNNRDVLLGEAKVAFGGRFSNTSYTLDTSISSMPAVQSAFFSGTLRAIHGECLVTCVSSDQVVIENSTISDFRMRGSRLARLASSSFSGLRAPKLKLRDCDGFSGAQFAAMAGLVRGTGTFWYKFEDCAPLGVSQAPASFGNYGITAGGGSSSTTSVRNTTMHVDTKYGQLNIIPIELINPTTGDPQAGLTFQPGDVYFSKDGAAPVNLTFLPSQSGGGIYNITLTAAEAACSQAMIVVKDQSSPAAFAPLPIHVTTYGNAAAKHEFDLDSPKIAITTDGLDANALKLDAIHKLRKTAYDSEIYPADGAIPSPQEMEFLLLSHQQRVLTGTDLKTKKINGVTDAATYTTNDSANPTQVIRTG